MSTEMTARLGLDYVMAAQAQKHVTVNEGLRHLDAVVQAYAESRSATVPARQRTRGRARGVLRRFGIPGTLLASLHGRSP